MLKHYWDLMVVECKFSLLPFFLRFLALFDLLFILGIVDLTIYVLIKQLILLTFLLLAFRVTNFLRPLVWEIDKFLDLDHRQVKCILVHAIFGFRVTGEIMILLLFEFAYKRIINRRLLNLFYITCESLLLFWLLQLEFGCVILLDNAFEIDR